MLLTRYNYLPDDVGLDLSASFHWISVMSLCSVTSKRFFSASATVCVINCVCVLTNLLRQPLEAQRCYDNHSNEHLQTSAFQNKKLFCSFCNFLPTSFSSLFLCIVFWFVSPLIFYSKQCLFLIFTLIFASNAELFQWSSLTTVALMDSTIIPASPPGRQTSRLISCIVIALLFHASLSLTI